MKHEQLSEQLLDAAEKATPGKWSLGSSKLAVWGSDGSIVCDAWESNTRPDGECEANASLIALANPANIRSLIEGHRDQLKTALDREAASQKRHDDKLDVLEAKIAQARKEALEEAARVCDDIMRRVDACETYANPETKMAHSECAALCALSIRALIAKEPANVAKETQE